MTMASTGATTHAKPERLRERICCDRMADDTTLYAFVIVITTGLIVVLPLSIRPPLDEDIAIAKPKLTWSGFSGSIIH